MKGKENEKADEFQIQKFYYQKIVAFLKKWVFFLFLIKRAFIWHRKIS